MANRSPPSCRPVFSKSGSGPPEALIFKQALLQALDAGPLVVSYLGHGSQNLWRAGLNSFDVQALANRNHLSLFLNMTCLNGFFHDVHATSFAEALLAAPGGAAAVWASSGLTSLATQEGLSERFFKAALGDHLPPGEAARVAKASVSNEDVRRTWILFGDPSTVLTIPPGPATPPPPDSPARGCACSLSRRPTGQGALLALVMTALIGFGVRWYRLKQMD